MTSSWLQAQLTPVNSTIYWNNNCGSKIEAKMAEIEARLVGTILNSVWKIFIILCKSFIIFQPTVWKSSSSMPLVNSYLMSEKQVRQKSRQETSANFCVFRTFGEYIIWKEHSGFGLKLHQSYFFTYIFTI
jgi:hypothetical protein